MSASAKDFLSQWTAKNIIDEAYVRSDGPDPRPAAFAARCRADGEATGWTEQQLCEAASELHGAPSLEACMAIEIDISAQKHLADIANQLSQGTRQPDQP